RAPRFEDPEPEQTQRADSAGARAAIALAPRSNVARAAHHRGHRAAPDRVFLPRPAWFDRILADDCRTRRRRCRLRTLTHHRWDRTHRHRWRYGREALARAGHRIFRTLYRKPHPRQGP